MRLILNLRGTNVLDLELRWPRADQAGQDAPTLEASGGGQYERAGTFGDPATISGFGFHAGAAR